MEIRRRFWLIEKATKKWWKYFASGVTHLSSLKDTFYKVQPSSHENIRMLLEIADQRALYVKIADRMHNMCTIQYQPSKSQRKTTEETLLFFMPLAMQLGLKEAAATFKKLCFAVLSKATSLVEGPA